MTNVINRLQLIRFYKKTLILNQTRSLRIKSCRSLSDKNKTVDNKVEEANKDESVKKKPIKLVYKNSFISLTNPQVKPLVEPKFQFSKPTAGPSVPKFITSTKPKEDIEISKSNLENLLKKRLPIVIPKKGVEILDEGLKQENLNSAKAGPLAKKPGIKYEKSIKGFEILEKIGKSEDNLNLAKQKPSFKDLVSKKNTLLKRTIDVSKLLSTPEETAATVKTLLEPIAKSSKEIAK